ncbi:MAG TPA: MOSC domain-containing protein [Gemmatimonadaceae bacterium]|nr:MOSC domain-containing protein [Gemmatimonadaceae bacterium]
MAVGATRTAWVTGLQRSSGGVPKLPVDRAVVRVGGMEGDRQANRKYHGGPDRALCLYAQERLDALADDGHPLSRGTLGENVTIAGLAWQDVRPGARLVMGGVEVEVTGFAAPCRQIAQGFADGVFSRVGEKVNPGWSRVYARVLVEGEVAVGDPVTLRT